VGNKRFNKDLIEKGVKFLLQGIGEDPNRPGLKETPARVAKFYAEWKANGESIKYTAFEEKYNSMVIVKNIPFFSLCEHHLLPFYGKASIAYIPNGKVVGLSKLVRVLKKYANRPQVQERIGKQVCDELERELDPQGVMIKIEAEHLCMAMRGVKTPGAVTITEEVRGLFFHANQTRQEAVELMK
jgi:GTP cyclohydrolase I